MIGNWREILVRAFKTLVRENWISLYAARLVKFISDPERTCNDHEKTFAI
jgi:hypothetical protein